MSEPDERSILVDMDNTITNLTHQYKLAEEWAGFCDEEKYKEEEFAIYPPSLNYPEDVYEKLKEQVTSGKFYRTMQAFPESVEAVKWLIDSGYDVWFCTIELPVEKYGISNFKEEKKEWITKVFGEKYGDKIVYERDKSRCKGKFLIDDNPAIVSQIENATWKAILVNRRYNEHINYGLRVSIPTMKEDLERIFHELK